MKYRKRPVIIEAFQWTGGPDQEEDPEWIIDAINAGQIWFKDHHMYIHTLEGDHQANIGDFIIQGIQGEIYPCKPDIFESTYEKVVVE